VLVPPRDPERLADALALLLADPALATRLGVEGAREVRRRFDRATNVGALVAIFAQHLGSTAGASRAGASTAVTA
jgi:glycosyltransferase involved in cell wall biosynthesis